MIRDESKQLFRRLCDPAQRVVLTTHINPDGDAIGSQASLGRYLQQQGKEVRIVNHDPVPDTLRFVALLDGRVELYEPSRHDADLGSSDLIILVDNSAPDRLGRMEPIMAALAGKTLCIDHHPARDAPWAHSIVDVDSCATTAMIYELTRDSGWSPDREAAEAIYVGLATDTGFFRFNSTNSRAHEIAADLLRLGVRPARVFGEIYERNPLAFIRVLGHTLTGLRLDADGAVASVEISRRLLETLDAVDVDATEITTLLLATDGVRVAILFRELADGRIKVSLRSKGALDVHRLASEFGGGGHRNASGIVMDGEMQDVLRAVMEKATLLIASTPRE